ncbi:Rieske (2Fe-2S) protein [Actinomadura chibensis]|uniref:Cytochrome bc1 complex Rieske iron-sulfur subunit n=1 Tax=Actinomadura chibensis TaxID=392828 RepID=A0A5D0NB62_9ACTN|nr:Rieske (2Fe-2S) protein [Actinomadura chibensis]TYB41576.1 Rieske (2Fe-2S) protein [Actinomadura chibensis]
MSDEVVSGGGGVGRRGVLCGGAVLGVAVLAGCGGGDKEKSASDLKGKEVAKVADVPVGGGKINGAEKVVVTQPTPGSFKAFTAVCTHQGCTVGSVSDGLIKCPCHGSEFKIADGAVRRGPADRALTEYPVQVKGGGIVVV